MPSRIKKTYSSPEYEARKLAYARLPLLKIERPLRIIRRHVLATIKSYTPQRDHDVFSLEREARAIKKALSTFMHPSGARYERMAATLLG